MGAHIAVPQDKIAAFCRKWRVKELSLFGSVLTDRFGPESHVDVLLAFEKGVPWDLWDLVDMREELKEIFSREVDIVEKQALRNPFRKREILGNREIIYAG